MKNLNKKIGAMVLAGMVVVGGCLSASKVDVHAARLDLNSLSYYWGFDVLDIKIDKNVDLQKYIEQFGDDYNVHSKSKIVLMNSIEFENKVKSRNLSEGIYRIVDIDGSISIIGIRK